MKAVQIAAIGAPLEERQVPDPEVGQGDVLVRVRAAGICHSDVHYRQGVSPVGPLPITPGHEVSGVIEACGDSAEGWAAGDRVCLHYLVTCGRCRHCLDGTEQFCKQGRMIGKTRDGGYAELISVPSRSVVRLPAGISFEHGAAMMCSSATSYHALRKARLAQGEQVAVFGAGGLGLSAVQLALALGAEAVYAVDINPARLEQARGLGAIPVDAAGGDPASTIRGLTGGRGVDVALELIGLPRTMSQAVGSLGVFGRAVLVGITDRPFSVDSYRELIGREAEIIGASDHLMSELPELLALAVSGALALSSIVTRRTPLASGPINAALDDLAAFRSESKTVIIP